jgi:hypothetical protein
LLELFKIFVKPVQKLQGQTYPTLNYVTVQYIWIMKKLKDRQQIWGKTTPIGLACQEALDVLKEYNNVLSKHPHAGIATVLDPRFNYAVFTKLYPIGHDLTDMEREASAIQRTQVKKEFKECFLAYETREQAMVAARRKQELVELADSTANLEASKEELSDDELYSIERPGYIQDESQSEYNRWFRQPPVPRETDPITYWKAKQYDFPILAAMARDYLAIPATSAPSECVFSTGGDIITKKRNRLSPDTFRWIICLRDWGVYTEEDEAEALEVLSDC